MYLPKDKGMNNVNYIDFDMERKKGNEVGSGYWLFSRVGLGFF